MEEIFISYKSERRDASRHLAQILRACGFSVWFDYGLLPGKNFGAQIEKKIRSSKVALVLWCPLSVASDWVKEEADLAKELGIFHPVRIAACTPPLGFRLDQYIDLSRWNGDPADNALRPLFDRLSMATGRSSPATCENLQPLRAEWIARGRPGMLDFKDAQPLDISLTSRHLPSARIGQGSGDLTARAETDRIRVSAKLVNSTDDLAKGGWLLPGAGKSQWFRDHSLGPEMVVLPKGEFIMGSPPDEVGRASDGREGPQHVVVIPTPFAVGRCAITFAEFTAFVEATGYEVSQSMYTFEADGVRLRANRSFRNPGFDQSSRHPVVGVSWHDAVAYCDWLSKLTGEDYRLLNENEWEYACRAGTSTAFWWGNSISTYQANYNGTRPYNDGPTGLNRKRTLVVDCFDPNPWGLFQVHGNVGEWCADTCTPNYRHEIAPPTADGRKTVRGGSWYLTAASLRSANRGRVAATDRSNDLGFRVTRAIHGG